MRTQLGLWVIAGVLLCGTAVASGGAEGGIGDATDGVETSFGYSLDAGPSCERRHASTKGAEANVAVEGVQHGFSTALPSFSTCWSEGTPALIADLVPTNRGVESGGERRQRLEADAQIEPRQEETQGQVGFVDPFLGTEGEAGASSSGASGRVVLLNQRVADLTLTLSATQQETAPGVAPTSARWSIREDGSPAWEPADDPVGVSWGERATRGVESLLGPILPAGMPFVPVPAQARASGSAGPLDDLQDAQLLGLAAVGLIPAMLAALYQRFTASASMQHERRAAIHKALAAWPQGATAGEVARALDMKRKTVEYHLHYCAKAGLVRAGVGPDGARRYSLGALPPRLGVSERLLSIIRERPGLSTAELAAVLGVPRDGVDRRVKEFAIQGVVECRLVDGERRMFPGGA